MHYMTRHLEALTDIPLGSEFHRPGDQFLATPIDAEYLVTRGKAREVAGDALAAPKATSQPLAAAVAIAQEPPQQDAAPTAEPPSGEPPTDGPQDVVAESVTEAGTGAPAAAPAPAPTPRRRVARQASEAHADSSTAVPTNDSAAG